MGGDEKNQTTKQWGRGIDDSTYCLVRQINRSWKVVYSSYMLYIYNMICSDVICIYIYMYYVRATNQQIGELDLGDCEAVVKSLF